MALYYLVDKNAVLSCRNEESAVCREWPYEHITPTAQKPIQHPKKWPKGHKHEKVAAERQQSIAKNMASMDKWIAEAKVLCFCSGFTPNRIL
jgi:Mitochondrial ribosomal protein mL59